MNKLAIKILFTIFALAIMCLPLTAQAQPGRIFINEFLASNISTNYDPDFQQYADWIEIYNGGGHFS